ncbi:MAG: uracil-DNA glycosylase [Clostridia bacterium]|nr:uracil-DNA glycosylase [Clostridia bacterium]
MDEWQKLLSEIADCGLCGLGSGALHRVPGQGDRQSPLMFIGEGPGQTEDEQGLAFVGAAGQLLTRMLDAIRIPRDRVYICNVVKCRPPRNRVPAPEEQQACLPYLHRQIALADPKVIVLLGGTAGQAILGAPVRVTREHGQWYKKDGRFYMQTFHPSGLLRDASKKALAWQDMQSLRDRLQELGLYDSLCW